MNEKNNQINQKADEATKNLEIAKDSVENVIEDLKTQNRLTAEQLEKQNQENQK